MNGCLLSTEPLKGHGGGRNIFQMFCVLSRNFCVPSRNFAFPCQTLVFSREDICISSQNLSVFVPHRKAHLTLLYIKKSSKAQIWDFIENICRENGGENTWNCAFRSVNRFGIFKSPSSFIHYPTLSVVFFTREKKLNVLSLIFWAILLY